MNTVINISWGIDLECVVIDLVLFHTSRSFIPLHECFGSRAVFDPLPKNSVSYPFSVFSPFRGLVGAIYFLVVPGENALIFWPGPSWLC